MSPGLWKKLRKARLAQVLLVYLGAAWGILQITGFLREEFQLPGWVTPLAVILLLIGLLVITGTAWVQGRPADEGEELPSPWEVDLIDLRRSVGRGRLPHLTWARAILGGVVAFALLFGGAGLYVLLSGRPPILSGPPEARAEAAPGIAVLPFRVAAPEMELWQEGMVDLLSTNLEGTAGLRKIDPRAVISRWRTRIGDGAEAPDDETALAVARDLGARYAVTGSIVGSGAELRIIARVFDVEATEAEGSAEIQGAPDAMLALVDALSVELLKQGLLPTAGQQPDVDLSRITTSSLLALRAYLKGEQLYRRSRPAEAIEHFRAAVEADSTFALAHYRLALSYSEEGVSSLAEEHAERAVALGEKLPRRERLLLRANAQYARGRLAAIETLSELTSRYPDDVEGWFLLGSAYFYLGPHALHPAERYVQALDRTIELSPYFGPAYSLLLRNAFWRGDSARVAVLLEGYRRIDSKSDYCAGFDLGYRLLWGSAEERAAALATIDTIHPEPLHCTSAALASRPELQGPIIERFQAVLDGDASSEDRLNALWGLAVVSLWEGKLRRARRLLAGVAPDNPARPHTARLYLLSLLAAPRDTFPVQPEVGALGSPDEPWNRFIVGALAANEGRWSDFRAQLDALEGRAREAAGDGDSLRTSEVRAFGRALAGYGGLRRGEGVTALREIEAALPQMPGFGPGFVRSTIAELLRLEAGAGWREHGDPERARRYLTSFRFWSSPFSVQAQYHLGATYEALGDPERARLHYARFVRWWQDADPELEPLVQRAHGALQRLTGEKSE